MKDRLWIFAVAIPFLIAACENESGQKHGTAELGGEIGGAKDHPIIPKDENPLNRPLTEAQIEQIREMQREAQQRLDKLPPERRAALEEAARKARSMTPEERQRMIEEASRHLTPEQKKMIEDHQKKIADGLSK
jgi:hypothetical protein